MDSKYDISTGKFVNRVSGEAIPDDEPVFILRGRDVHAAEIIHAYAGKCNKHLHVDAVLAVARRFEKFASDYPGRMKEPDTARIHDEESASDVHPGPTEFTEEQLAADFILLYFHYAHLPNSLAAISKPFCDLAHRIVTTLPRNPERSVALRKLLEAKDAAVRANV